jgi:hypothetical protein
MIIENIYYVYAHISPISKNIFYIGIGSNHRVIEGGRLRNKKWQEQVYKDGGFLFEFLHKNISKKEALILERKYILKYGLHNLTNIVGENGNSTAFKKGGIPWNKGLINAQACATKKVFYNNKQYDSVQDLINELNIGTTTFYRKLKKGILKIKYVHTNNCDK